MRTALGDVPDRLLADMSMADAWEYLRARRARPSRRAFLRTVAGAAGVAMAGPALWSRPSLARASVPAGVHLSTGADPRRQATISWSTETPVASPRVALGTDAHDLGRVVEAETRTVTGHPTLYHHALVDGLPPGTRLHYRISHEGIDDDHAVTGTLRTAPPAPQPFRFASMGDMGANDAGAAVTSMVEAAAPDVVFMVGDLCYADRLGGSFEPPEPVATNPITQDLEQWDLWLAQVERSAARTPWITTTGNHEMEVGQGPLGYDGFLARMALPGNGAPGTPTFVARYGNVAFVALDANDVSHEIPRNRGYSRGVQRDWVATTLADLRSDPRVDFVVAGYHHCAYSSNTVHASDGGVREAWGDLVDEHEVDLVVNGHNHSYERTHPIRGGEHTREAPAGAVVEPARDGTVYVCAGGGGQASYPSTLHPVSYVWREDRSREPELAEWSAVRYLGDHSLLVVDVSPRDSSGTATMDVVALAEDTREPVDRFRIVRRRSG